MHTDAGMREITTEEDLRALVGEPNRFARDKARPSLSAVHRQWLAHSPFCLMATAGAEGTCDVSPKGDPPGWVLVLDDHTVALPDRPGNRRVDGFRNILANPHVGLLFLIPGRGDTLRITGRARLVAEAPWFDQLVVKGHRPQLAVLVDVEQVMFHCAKAFMRADLWAPGSWDPDAVPSRAAIARAIERPEDDPATLEAYYGPSYAESLYRTH